MKTDQSFCFNISNIGRKRNLADIRLKYRASKMLKTKKKILKNWKIWKYSTYLTYQFLTKTHFLILFISKYSKV